VVAIVNRQLPGLVFPHQVKADRKWGYINKVGTMVVPARYEEAHRYSEGLAAVKVEHKWGFIDQTGKKELPKCGLARNWAISTTWEILFGR